MAAPARYYDGVTAQVIEAGAKWGIGELLVYRADDFSIVARWRLEDIIVLGDTEHEAIPAISVAGSDARLIVVDPALRAELARVAYLAPLVAPRPPVAKRILKLGAALVVLVAAFWGIVDYGSEYAAPLVPYRLQARLGREVRSELLAGHTLCTGQEGLAAINGLANRLARTGELGHPVEVAIVRGGPVNAFTLPGGYLVFYSKLIDDAKDGEEVAGVLAHEIGHAINEHPIKGLARQYGDQSPPQPADRRLLGPRHLGLGRRIAAGVAQRPRLRAPGRRHRHPAAGKTRPARRRHVALLRAADAARAQGRSAIARDLVRSSADRGADRGDPAAAHRAAGVHRPGVAGAAFHLRLRGQAH